MDHDWRFYVRGRIFAAKDGENLELYKHKKCALKGDELDEDSRVGGFCAQCGQSGTIYHVKKTADYYQHILDSVLYDVFEGNETRPDQETVDRYEQLARAKRGVNWTPPERDYSSAVRHGRMLLEEVGEVGTVEVGESIPSSEEPSEDIPLENGEDTPESGEEPSMTIEVEVDAEKAKATLSELESQIADLQTKKDKLKEVKE